MSTCYCYESLMNEALTDTYLGRTVELRHTLFKENMLLATPDFPLLRQGGLT